MPTSCFTLTPIVSYAWDTPCFLPPAYKVVGRQCFYTCLLVFLFTGGGFHDVTSRGTPLRKAPLLRATCSPRMAPPPRTAPPRMASPKGRHPLRMASPMDSTPLRAVGKRAFLMECFLAKL